MEQWKNIPGYPDYQVSNLGRVKSFKRKTPYILTNHPYSNGYRWVKLSNENGQKSCLVHRLVLMAFCPIDDMEQMQVNHLNCNREDNRLENLEWVTPEENRNYREKVKHTPKAQTILVQFLDSRDDLIFDSKEACAEYFGVTRKAIDKYLQTQNIRSDRKVQAHFYLLGNTYELNSPGRPVRQS